MKVLDNCSLLHHNTFGVDVRCRRFFEYGSKEELHQILECLRGEKNTAFFHIGEGSNLLFTSDYDGIILHSAIKFSEVVEKNSKYVYLRVGAGEKWDELVGWCISQGYYGLENLSYIPGEVGASAVQNIGAYGKEAGDFIVSVETMDVETGAIRIFSHDECLYGYRKSVFKEQLRGKYVVTSVTFQLSKQFSPDLSYGALAREVDARGLSADDLSAEMLRNLVIEVRRSKLPEPAVLGSAGSFFMNPVVEESVARQLLQKYPQMPHYEVEAGVKVPAGWLIEQCGWKGKRQGKVGVYEKQALVLVNYGGATGEDICRLSADIQNDVKQKFGISIFPEVNFI